MRTLLFPILLILMVFSCTNPINTTEKSTSSRFNKMNEMQFTFLVFDKSKTEAFFSRYDPFDSNNKYFKEDLLKLRKWKFSNNSQGRFVSFKNNTESPNYEDFEIALDDLNEKYFENNKEYFEFSIQYLFFYQCLPAEIQNKWTQSTEGDFKFNAAFFALLREKCHIIDKMIYGEIGYWDKKLEPIFFEYIFNEITPERAKKIKEIIQKEEVFNDIRFQSDRENFIYFLDKTISNEWRLILTDWD